MAKTIDELDPWEYRPIEELAADADPVTDPRYSYASDVFGHSGCMIIVDNSKSPTPVYKIPLPISKIITLGFDQKFAAGREAAMADVRRLIGAERVK